LQQEKDLALKKPRICGLDFSKFLTADSHINDLTLPSFLLVLTACLYLIATAPYIRRRDRIYPLHPPKPRHPRVFFLPFTNTFYTL
jgi:hypothetical protein